MKKVVFAAIAAVSFVGSAFAAGTAPQTFVVKATLDAKCRTTSSAQEVNFGVYTAFGGPAVPAPTATLAFECTNGLTATAALDATPGSLVGVPYTLALGSDTAVVGAGAAGGTTHSYVLTGTMTTGLAGDTAGATSQNRTLTISY